MCVSVLVVVAYIGPQTPISYILFPYTQSSTFDPWLDRRVLLYAPPNQLVYFLTSPRISCRVGPQMKRLPSIRQGP